MENEKKIKVIKSIFIDGVSYKYDNRRTTVGKINDGFFIEMNIVSKDDRPRAVHTRLKGKVTVTYFTLSKEATEILFLALADQLGVNVQTGNL